MSYCFSCGDAHAPARHSVLGRRRFLGMAAAAAATVATERAWAAEPAKPGNVMSPDAALKELMAGNKRYAQGLTRRHDFRSERSALAGGQNPYAAILGCADSRVSPEFAFDSFRGDLFVMRVAGNFVNDDILASIEYGVAVLGTPLLMVLGHASCGAVSSTIKSLDSNTTLPGHLPSLVTSLTPAVNAVTGKPGDRLVNATKENVRLNVERLKAATPIVSQAVADKKFMVVGGYYDLKTGLVERVV